MDGVFVVVGVAKTSKISPRDADVTASCGVRRRTYSLIAATCQRRNDKWARHLTTRENKFRLTDNIYGTHKFGGGLLFIFSTWPDPEFGSGGGQVERRRPNIGAAVAESIMLLLYCGPINDEVMMMMMTMMIQPANEHLLHGKRPISCSAVGNKLSYTRLWLYSTSRIRKFVRCVNKSTCRSPANEISSS